MSTERWTISILGEPSCDSDVEASCVRVLEGDADPWILGSHWAIVAKDKARDRWVLLTDRYGTVHVYAAERAGRVEAFGASFFGLASVARDRELDVKAIAAFCAQGFFPSDHTWLRAIRIIRPATRVDLAPDGAVAGERRWAEWRYEPDPTIDPIDRFATILHDATARALRGGRVLVPISGGLDSRCTVAAIPRESAPGCQSYSYGYSADSAELRIAARIARSRGLSYTGHLVHEYLFDRLDDIIQSVEGFQDVTQSRQSAVSPWLAAHGSHVIAAHWGDVWFDSMGYEDQPGHIGLSSRIDGAAKKFLKHGRDWFSSNVPAFRDEGGGDRVVREALEDDAVRIPESLPPDLWIKALKTETWSFRWTLASLRTYALAVVPRLPFYERSMEELVCSQTPSVFRDRRVQIEYLRRYASDLAAIEWQETGAALRWGREGEHLAIPSRALRKLSRMMRGSKLILRNWEVQFLSDRGRAALRDRTAADGLRLHELVPRDAVIGLLSELDRNPSRENGYVASMLLTMSATMELLGAC
jgi:hypothetical protein